MKNTVFVIVLLVTVFTITNYTTFASAQEAPSTKAHLSIGSNHLGSMITTQTVSDDGSVWIFVTATEPVERERMTINVRFTDKDGQELIDVNYDIKATQNNQVILPKTMVNHQMGIGDHLTQPLPSNGKVDIDITIHGIGADSFAGPNGESIETTVVPEFGAITTIVLGISILSIVVISAKNRAIFKPITSS